MTTLGQALQDYLRLRRQMGYYLERDQPQLEAFVAYCVRAGVEDRIITGLAVQWAKIPATAHPVIWRKRLSMVRQFARYVATIDPGSEVPPQDLLPASQPRIAPYIYSPHEIEALIAAARSLRRPLAAAMFATVIGLLASTGIRLREALALDRLDVDLCEGVLEIRACTNHRARQVPLHPSTTEALGRYLSVRDGRYPYVLTPSFFVTSWGRRPTKTVFAQTFRTLIAQAGLEGRGTRVRPRPHDLRHTFAVHTLIRWYQCGEDIDPKMPALSTYLGHVSPESTYWYLQSVPELQVLVSGRLERLELVLS